ncbi:P-loop NTPase [Sphingomonas sp. H39-1-10]|uniref:tyrosine-protein kinase family protein n=1 Tax=Sphingomonas pollutisoli TaxID=3030829 RepID=UPI0023B9E34F|nr:P-loop NTPase [Sphingomonas pollutisoli]MDF0486571.1 P-loop NTPase [Sphingomonas pollutisoli]
MKYNSREWDELSVRIADLLVAEARVGDTLPEEAARLSRDRTFLFRRAAAMLGDASAAAGTVQSVWPPAAGPGFADDLFALKSPHSPRVAELRRVAQTLAMRWFLAEPKHKALSIISADRREGRTAVASNLACIFAQSGVRTLLIDADLHNPAIHTKFSIADAPPGATHRPVRGVENLWVTPAATLTALRHDHFMQSALQSLIATMREEFEVIFVDTPAAATSNDYQVAALATTGALCVTRAGVTRARRSSRMLDLCEDAGIVIVGGVMLRP